MTISHNGALACPDPTPQERLLVTAAVQGAEYACSALTVEDLVEMTDPAHVIRADVIRDLLLGRHGELDPRGVRVSGARIVDRLDLDHVNAAAGVELLGCVITEPITAEYAVLPRLNLRGSRITALHADGLRITGELILERVRARWDGDKGTIRLILAHIGGQLDLSDAEITNTGGAAVLADRLHVEADVFLRRTHASGAGTIGVARLVNARIGGQLECSDTRTINTTGPAVLADSIRVGNNLSLIDVQAAGSGDLGTVRLVNARVGGQLQWSGGKVVNTSGPALIADGIHVDTSMAIRDLNASGSDAKGTVQLPAARVDGQIGWQVGKITNDRGPALAAEGLQVGTDLFVRGLHATGSGKLGTIRLTRAHIQGSSSWQDITLANDSGPAFHADDLRTGGNLMLLRVDSRTSSDHGAIRMPRARISGQLEIVESTMANLGGPAWHADGIQIGASLVHRQLHLTVRNSVMAMRLPGATIGGQLVNDELRIDLPSGIALELEGTQVATSVVLPTAVLCPEHDAAEPRCTGTLLIGLDDFTYTTLGRQTWKQWLHLIRHHAPAYRPQPYQQLAAVEHAAGHDNNAREILIAQQEDLRRREPRALGGRLPQIRHRMWGWLGSYGYRAHRLVAALVVVLTLAAGVAYTAGQVPTRPGHHAAERVSPANTTGTPAGVAGTPCSTAELLGLGIDRGLPLGATGLRARCDLDTATRRGQTFTYALWFLQALLWALATLTIAAYTGLIRKPA